MKKLKTLLNGSNIGLLVKQVSFLHIFVVLLSLNLIGTSSYAQNASFGKNTLIYSETVGKAKTGHHSGEDITSVAFDLDVLRPDHSTPKTPDFLNNSADFFISLVFIQKKIALVSFDHELAHVSSLQTSNPRAPPIALA